MTHVDFSDFFEALHDKSPFPWQTDLARYVVQEKHWPPLLDLPTGSGKTAAIDVAVFALALEADRPEGEPRRVARRTFFVVDRRIVVDEAARRARRIAGKLQKSPPRSQLETDPPRRSPEIGTARREPINMPINPIKSGLCASPSCAGGCTAMTPGRIRRPSHWSAPRLWTRLARGSYFVDMVWGGPAGWSTPG